MAFSQQTRRPFGAKEDPPRSFRDTVNWEEAASHTRRRVVCRGVTTSRNSSRLQPLRYINRRVALAFASSVFGAPAQADASCNISNAVLKLPAGQTGLVAPSGKPSFIAGAIGVQNYTCSDAGTYTSVGALAELVDISCSYGTSSFDTIQDNWYLIWTVLPAGTPPLATIGNPEPLGEHYFIPNPVTGTGLSPKWDFTSHGTTSGNRNAFVIGARSGGLPSPSGSANVDWLSLSNVQGRLANQVFRVDTKGGQPPSSCRPGTSISVKYTSKYWFFGSTL